MKAPSPFALQGSRRAAALVIVLACLVFLAALAIAFLVSIRTELKSSKSYADGVNARLLAQSAFNLVSDQITEATKGLDANGNLVTWASQPGLIRTYDPVGAAQTFFKLYSSDRMQGKGAIDLSADDEKVSPTWNKDTAVYTDLNQPLVISGTRRYPIIDGNGLSPGLSDTAGTTSVPGAAYDLDGDGKWDVEGFNVVDAPVESSASNPVPMPVKWLYVLQEGQIVSPSGGSGKTADFAASGADGPSASNPIVGRIAFWTDDESCKVNVNTASEGVYWDMPRIKSNMEDVLKMNQPISGEYQRYPGHPATTSLSTVIKPPSDFPTTPVPKCSYDFNKSKSFVLCSASTWRDYLWAQKLYDVIPRIGTGGSYAGSKQTASLATQPPPMALDAERLYASVDEFLFSATAAAPGIRGLNETVLTGSTTPAILSNQTLERDKFFLTASSRAPDLNLFGKPRVSMWPITLDVKSGTPVMTAYDRLIAFCTTSGANGCRYYFERQDPNSPTTDLPETGSTTGLGRNRMLMEYLRHLTDQQIPGFGGKFRDKYGADTDQILTEVFDYIRCTNLNDRSNVTSTQDGRYTPGIKGTWKGWNWEDKIGIGQVVPIVDGATRGFGRFPSVQGASVLFVGQVDGDDPLVPRDPITHKSVPPYPESTSQVELSTGKPLPVYSNNTPDATIVNPAVAPGSMRVQAVFIPQFFTASVGAPWMFPNFQYSVDTSDLRLSGPDGNAPFTFPDNTANPERGNITKNDISLDETGYGDQLGLRQGLRVGRIKLLSASMDIPKGSYRLRGKVVIRLFAAEAVPSPAPSETIVQTVTLDFSGTPPFDVGGADGLGLAYDHVANVNTGGWWDSTVHYVNYRSFTGNSPGYYAADPDNPNSPDNKNKANGNRFTGAFSTTCAQGFIIPPDAIRTVRTVSGDTRLVAASTTPQPELFEANPATERLLGAHSFFTGYGHPYYGAALGRLVPDLSYRFGTGNWSDISTANMQTNAQDGAQPISWVFGYIGFSPASDIPLNGVAVGKSTDFEEEDIPGDWDNGPFLVRDGPYINKADEGDRGGVSATSKMEPYGWNFKNNASSFLNGTLFSPNRIVPSPVTLGSLPTGVKAGRPWQTLLFRPEPGHPGSRYKVGGSLLPGTVPDHLLLDLFHMPVVEPYPISEPFSTAGRINMNYQIAPFTYINRDTGIRALLKGEKVIAIPSSKVNTYKDYNQTGNSTNIRLDVNPDETLKGFTNRFTKGADGSAPDIFRSPSEICELPIVPSGATYAAMTSAGPANYWSANQLTGDNSKERIYATLYPRLTTKSNTFTIHVRVQTLQKAAGTAPGTWTEGRDQVTSEYRGYQTIERYVDPGDPRLPDFADASEFSSAKTVGSFYKTRVVAAKQFTP